MDDWVVDSPVTLHDPPSVGRVVMDEYDIIETPENVDLQRRLAGIGSRFVAGLLDALLMVGVLVIVVLISLAFGIRAFLYYGTSLAHQADAWMFALLLVLGFLIYWGYYVLFETWMNGQTPGKRYMRIRVVQQEGGAISFPAVAIRNLLRAVDALGFYAVAGVAMFMTRRVQRLGDLAAGTVVVSEEIPDYAAKADKKTKVLDGVPAAAAIGGTLLKPQEYRLLRNYWLRRDQLSLQARVQLLPELLQPILRRLGTPLTEYTLVSLEWRVEELLRQARAEHPGGTGPEPGGEEVP